MKTIEITVYNIKELETINKKTYDKVIQRVSDYLINDRFNFASDDALYILNEKYKLEITEKNIYYSISYCQGDGFSFIDNDILSYTRLKNKSNDRNVFEKWIADNLSNDEMTMLLDYLNSDYNIDIIKTSHNYCHPYTCKIDYEYFYSSDDENYKVKINNFISKLCDRLFDNVYVKICGEIETILYSYYDITTDDVIEFINDNNYYYDIDGNLY